MKPNHIQVITFSPTRTSHRVATAIAEGAAAQGQLSEAVSTIDLTTAAELDASALCKGSDCLVVLSAPVYGGHIAPLARKRMEGIDGGGAQAVVVAVYGNRDYEQALCDLAQLATEHNYRVIGAATFVGEHSFSTPKTPIGVGRPNANDIDEAKELGARVWDKMAATPEGMEPNVVDVTTIERPKQSVWARICFIGTILSWKLKKVSSPRKPECNADLCKHCGKCTSVCPTGAITKGNECETDETKCTKCCACVKICANGARSFNSPFAPLLAKYYASDRENKTLV